MIYGLYLSATGVMANSYRQDVIGNNLANSETVGFKRNLAMFQERSTEAKARGLWPSSTDPMLERLGGGLLLSPTMVDTSQGELEQTGNPLDVAIQGQGYLMVDDHGQQRLTRDGRMMIDRTGHLVMANGEGQRVLDGAGKPIVLQLSARTEIGDDGQISQDGQAVARLGVYRPADEGKLKNKGGNLLAIMDGRPPTAVEATVRSGFVERANVDPSTELVQLMETQRMLEANANMIRYQDQTLSRLVNDVGRIG
ncbi:MAG: flagellar hook basal-body protein [Phycisphaerales bacterium]|nr:flagellar hook basal-body protein [Phycisphaerales bacterium]